MSQTHLGVVTGTSIDKRGEPVAWVQPLLDAESWEEVDPDDFPTRGSVFWPMANDAVRDALVFFRPKENTVKMLGVKDELMVAEPRTALEILDLRWLGEIEQVRSGLNAGLDLPAVPPVRSLVWCSDEVLLGPVGFEQGPGGSIIEKSNRHRIPCFRPRPGDIRQVSHDGLTRYVFARKSVGAPESFVDWDDDKHVARRALEFAADLAKKSGAALDVSKHLVEEAAEAMTSQGAKADLKWRVNELDRTRSLIGLLRESNELAKEVVAALRKHPLIEEEIEEVKSAERKAAREDAQTALQGERDEIARLAKVRAEADAALEAVRRRIEDTETEEMRRTAETEDRIRGAIESAVRNVPELVAQISVLRPFLSGANTAAARVDSRPVLPQWQIGNETISTVKDLRKRMTPTMKSVGLAASTYQRLHAAFSARLLPWICGSRSFDLLKAYAGVATAGRIAFVDITAAVTEPGDIFGRVDLARHRFVPHAAGLIDLVHVAKESSGFSLVVLDGANRAATESYLLPLVQTILYRTRKLPLFHPSAVAPDDPYRECSTVDWPDNILLAATLVEGPTTLPVAADLWADGVLIDADAGSDTPPGELQDVSTELSEIDPKSTLLKPATTGESALESLEGVVSRALRQVAIRLERGFSGFPLEATALQREIVKGVLVPYLASIPDDDDREGVLSQAKKALGAEAVVGIEEAVSNARRRIA